MVQAVVNEDTTADAASLQKENGRLRKELEMYRELQRVTIVDARIVLCRHCSACSTCVLLHAASHCQAAVGCTCYHLTCHADIESGFTLCWFDSSTARLRSSMSCRQCRFPMFQSFTIP